jgi:hypothetical protein
MLVVRASLGQPRASRRIQSPALTQVNRQTIAPRLCDLDMTCAADSLVISHM